MTKETKLTWNLDDILRVDQFDVLLAEFSHDFQQFSAWFERLQPDMDERTFQAYIAFSEGVAAKVQRLYALGHLLLQEDVHSPLAQLMHSKALDISAKYFDAAIKIDHWLLGKEVGEKPVLDDKNAQRLFSSVPDLEFVLTTMRSKEQFALNADVESVIALKDTTGNAPLLLLREHLETEQHYFFKPRGKRGKTLKTKSEVLRHVASPHPEIREAAYRALLQAYEKNRERYFTIYQAVVKDWVNEAKLRGYPAPISVRNNSNNLPDEAVDTLLRVCSENTGIFQRYFCFKAKELGMKRLRRFDLYAPLEQKESPKIPFQDALDLVLSTFRQFSPQFAAQATRIVNAKHIDSHPRPQKSGGAFCSTITPDIKPYVFLNFVGDDKSVFTLAHELGHGVHALYAEHLPISSQHAGLAVCETASTFCEMILFEKIFAQADTKRKKSMLAQKIADTYASTIRQTYFVRFEVLAHEAIARGATLDELEKMWFGGLTEQFGGSVAVDPIFRNEWAYIPHIVSTPFYCYAYAFGDLLSLSLYATYKERGEEFVPAIENILAAGGSADPRQLLRGVGVDITSPEFWKSGFQIIEKMQNQLEAY